MMNSAPAAVISPALTGSVLRVLHLHSGNMIGGIESVLRTLAEFAPSRPEATQELAVVFDGSFAESIRATGLTVHTLPEVQLRNPLSVLRARRELAGLLKRSPFDAVISHSPWCQVVFGPVFKQADIPVLYWMHNNFDGHWLQKLASRNVPDFAICNSEYTQSTLAQVYPRTPSAIVHYPVKASVPAMSRDQLRHDLGASPDTVVILMASRMEHWKGHFNLLHAAAALQPKSDWIIWIAGAPQSNDERVYHESVLAEVNRQNLKSRVHFLGQRSDVPALMRAADIFCQPNAAPEPFGVVFVEALQAGVPVVTFSMGGPREILDASSGLLIAPGDLAGLTACLSRLIDDASLRAAFRVTGPARAKLLCDPVQQLREVYTTIASVVRNRKGVTA